MYGRGNGECEMSGIFSIQSLESSAALTNPGGRRRRLQFVTHNVDAGLHQCRRIMREWVKPEELGPVEFTCPPNSSAPDPRASPAYNGGDAPDHAAALNGSIPRRLPPRFASMTAAACWARSWCSRPP